MRRIIFFAIFIFAGLLSPLCHAYSGGSGTATDPYLISTSEQMNTIGTEPNDWDDSFKLMANIDMSAYTGTQYNIIGGTTGFTGTFDGNGHILSNLTITASSQNYVGLFGYVGSSGQIKNLGVENVNITGQGYVGGLVGDNDGTILSCYATGTVSGSDYTGGLVGECFHGTISSCYAIGTVNGSDYTGGLVGASVFCAIRYCYTASTVSGSYSVGGLVGLNSDFPITSCYATGSVSGSSYVGGLAGSNLRGFIRNCYAASTVNGSSNVGGLIGYDGSYRVSNCFWDTETSGQATSAGGIGKTTSQMQTLSTFTDAEWDFINETANGSGNFWRMCTDGLDYPRLNWQSTDGDMTCPDGVDMEDFNVFARRWLRTNCTEANNYCDTADMDYSGCVTAADYAVFAGHWLEM